MNDDPKDIDIEPGNPQSHELPFVPSVIDEHEDAPQFDKSLASPAVLDEENPSGGDATDSEPLDLDKAMSDAGISNKDRG